jgi:hypothetical protein
MEKIKKRMTLSICLIPLVVIIIYTSCTSASIDDRKEGFIGDGFRIYVRLDMRDIPETMTDNQIDMLLVEKGKERFSQLVFAFKEITDRVVPEIQNGKIMYPQCHLLFKNENYENIDGFVEFSVSREFKEAYFASYPPLKKEEDE